MKTLNHLKSGASLTEVVHNFGKKNQAFIQWSRKKLKYVGNVSAAPTTAKMVSLVCDKVLKKRLR